jgi:hypothetical protein
VGGQHHASAAFTPRKESLYSLTRRVGRPQSHSRRYEEKHFLPPLPCCIKHDCGPLAEWPTWKNWKVLEKPCLSDTLSTTNLKRTGPGSNAGLRGDRKCSKFQTTRSTDVTLHAMLLSAFALRFTYNGGYTGPQSNRRQPRLARPWGTKLFPDPFREKSGVMKWVGNKESNFFCVCRCRRVEGAETVKDTAILRRATFCCLVRKR